jgi:Arc/MetJ-type ribon-helix-helix transcriptional regulator
MATQTLTITLPQELADDIRNKVTSGEFSSESDVIASALKSLETVDSPHDAEAVDRWLRETVVPIALKMEADPAHGRSAEEVLALLEKDSQEQTDGVHAA